MNPSPKDFCKSNDVCPEEKPFVLQYKTMSEAWNACPRADWLIWILEKIGHKLDSKTLRLFVCWCVRETPLFGGQKVWDLLTDERSRNAVVVTERFANGDATEEELADARDAARDASWSAAWSAAWAARYAASAAEDAPDAAWSAAWFAASSPSDASDAGSHAQVCQANHFRTLFKNPFQN